MTNIRRGDIYYIRDTGGATGSEHRKDRPAIVVSNDIGNSHSPVVSVVYLTTTRKRKRLPTHVDVMATIKSTAMCEHVYSISTERLERHLGHITKSEQEAIDRALSIALQIEIREESEPMSQLSILESGVVPVYTTDKGERVVDGRELWRGLESKQDFSTWIKKRFDECEAVENMDYFRFHKKMEANNATIIEYIIKLATAKEMAMLERNEVGKQVRKHFIAVEERYDQQNVDASQLSPQMQLLTQMVNTMAQQEIKQAEIQRQLTATTEKVESVQNTLTLVQDTIIQRDADWRKSVNKIFNNAVKASGTSDYKSFRHETYGILEQRAHCDLARRLRGMESRLHDRGATKTQIDNLSKMDVIEEDPKLKEIYTSIVKELSIRYIHAV